MKRGQFIFFVLSVIVALTLVALPQIWIYFFMAIDFYTPWTAFDSRIYHKYHEFVTKNLPDREELPLPEINAKDASYSAVEKLSNGFTFPLVIRGLLGNTTGVQLWGNPDWWIERYGDEKLLCGTLSEVVEDCTVRGFFEAIKNGNPFYISGASEIFERHPELHDMIDNENIRAIEPSKRTATQIFMGLPNMGSDIHSAIGINIFRQVTGRKKWWFIPPSETAFLMPAINVNGFSSHTLTKVGKGQEIMSPWFSKLRRYTSTLNPGDVLVNPPWYWHGILNLGEPNELVIGSPTRYGGAQIANKAAMKNNIFFTLNAYLSLVRRYGAAALKPGFKINLQADIANNRRDREKKDLRPDGLEEFALRQQTDYNLQDASHELEANVLENAHPFDFAD